MQKMQWYQTVHQRESSVCELDDMGGTYSAEIVCGHTPSMGSHTAPASFASAPRHMGLDSRAKRMARWQKMQRRTERSGSGSGMERA
jgi:hypothetical protein